MSLSLAPLCRNGPQVNSVGFGLMGLSVGYGEAKPDIERFALLDKAYEMGAHPWGTSDYYGDSEDLLGQYLKANPEKRKNIFLATKFGAKDFPTTGEVNSSPEYCKKFMGESLERLCLPNVDLYYGHRLDKSTPIEKQCKLWLSLRTRGGSSIWGFQSVPQILCAVLMQFTLFQPSSVAVIAYSPLNRGMPTGALKSADDVEEGDIRKIIPRFSRENFPKNLELVEKFRAVAKRKGFTTGQVALAWLMAQGEDIFPIPGTTRVERLKENIESCNVNLSKEELAELRKVVDDTEVAGARYPDRFMKDTYVDTPPL